MHINRIKLDEEESIWASAKFYTLTSAGTDKC